MAEVAMIVFGVVVVVMLYRIAQGVEAIKEHLSGPDADGDHLDEI